MMAPAALRKRNALIEKYRYLVPITAGRISRRPTTDLDREDMVGAGLIGLCKAATLYDAGRGVKFETYAIALIRGAILEQFRTLDFYPRLAREKEKLSGVKLPEVASLEAVVGTSPFDYRSKLHLADTLLDESDGPEALAFRAERLRALAASLARLPAREADVIRRYYTGGETFKAIAAALEISESRAYQLHGQAISRLARDGALRDSVLA